VGSDIAVAGAFHVTRRRGFDEGDIVAPEPFQFARFRKEREMWIVEVHIERSAYLNDVRPALEALLRVANEGDLVEIEVGSIGRRIHIQEGLRDEITLPFQEAERIWNSELFDRVRAELARDLPDDESDLEVPVTTLAEARRALAKRLAFAGENDGVVAARKLLDGDASPEAVALVLDAVERKWIIPAPMSGADEAIVKSVLRHHAHPQIEAVCRERLEALGDRKDFASERMREALRSILAR
jgi:hypothetical protein